MNDLTLAASEVRIVVHAGREYFVSEVDGRQCRHGHHRLEGAIDCVQKRRCIGRYCLVRFIEPTRVAR